MQNQPIIPRELHSTGGMIPLPGSTNVPHSRVELMLEARNLMDKDFLSKSDPICIVYLKGLGLKSEEYFEIGRTEVIYNNLNPKWNNKIHLDYFFETKQILRFDIYDIDANDPVDLSRHDFLGRCECHLADIVSTTEDFLRLDLRNGKRQKGALFVRAEEVDEGQKELVHLICHGKNLAKPHFCCSCLFSVDPFLEFHRIYPNGIMQLVHRTEVEKNTVNPEWKPIEVSVRHLCEGDKNRQFLVECFDFKITGRHVFLGSAKLTVNQLVSPKNRNQVIYLEKQKNCINGTIQFVQATCHREFTFLDFIKGGMQLEFAVSIDFTASNGNPLSPNSRHYIDQFYLNQYELAVRSVLEICEHYNASKYFEAFGFGAKIIPSQNVSHLFNLNIDSKQSGVYGVKGVMDAYRSALSRVELYGPTNFEPTIRTMLEKCKSFPRNGSKYQILLILTDGLITDMDRTKLAIIEASLQPLSIIVKLIRINNIIGVGEEDFAKMNELDSDENLLRHGVYVAKRDIVQFVPFCNYYNAVRSAESKISEQQQMQIQVELAKV
ncbi:C2 domain-containing protein [Meloidogyne graminicola]|uniref:C2 domain-containing protein n=1 Tax=Meloidogyne graminicola TaxID=189291 RepID=A0A8S9ZTP9_9BILA|nr:C2 domain-containing protein [Meloidogyne graminicola]